MNFEISLTHDFLVEAKKLKKRYRSFEDDLEDFKDSLQENPFQGVELCPGIRKIRMAIASNSHPTSSTPSCSSPPNSSTYRPAGSPSSR